MSSAHLFLILYTTYDYHVRDRVSPPSAFLKEKSTTWSDPGATNWHSNFPHTHAEGENALLFPPHLSLPNSTHTHINQTFPGVGAPRPLLCSAAPSRRSQACCCVSVWFGEREKVEFSSSRPSDLVAFLAKSEGDKVAYTLGKRPSRWRLEMRNSPILVPYSIHGT